MRTRLTTSPRLAAQYIAKGECVAFPTETVYGLGANALDARAIAKVFRAKGRPSDNPLIVHIGSIEMIEMLARKITPIAELLVEQFFPGPLTIVLRKSDRVPGIVTAGLNTVGIRMPSHPVANLFLQKCGIPVVAPSANRSGAPSPTTWQAVHRDLDGRIACILKAGHTTIGIESTVVDCTGRSPEILRPGGISLEQLQRVVPSTRVARHLDSRAPKSPGMRYRHYSPKARVVLLDDPRAFEPTEPSAYIGIDRPPRRARFVRVRICRDISNYAHALYDFFRACDDAQVRTICCQTVTEGGLGLGLMDRLRRAAQRESR
jgi:L-threonylcarbamoyladenylate synthase